MSSDFFWGGNLFLLCFAFVLSRLIDEPMDRDTKGLAMGVGGMGWFVFCAWRLRLLLYEINLLQHP